MNCMETNKQYISPFLLYGINKVILIWNNMRLRNDDTVVIYGCTIPLRRRLTDNSTKTHCKNICSEAFLSGIIFASASVCAHLHNAQLTLRQNPSESFQEQGPSKPSKSYSYITHDVTLVCHL